MTGAQRIAPTLPPPFIPVFSRADKNRRVILVPNLSRSFSSIAAAILRKRGFTAVALPLADDAAQFLGKRHVHNDMCFPCQVITGEILLFLSQTTIPPGRIAVALTKNCRDCRAGQYQVLVRKALDEAGYPEVAIVTSGDDRKHMHPGFIVGAGSMLSMLWGVAIADSLDAMVRRTRPYEREKGTVDRLYEEHLQQITATFERSVHSSLAALRDAVTAFNAVALHDGPRRPRALIIGEILCNYHDSANRHLVRYLEKHGMEVLLPDMFNFFWRQVIVDRDASVRKLAKRAGMTRLGAEVQGLVYRHVFERVRRVYSRFRWYEKRPLIDDLVQDIDGQVDRSFVAGEGWLIPAEIVHYAKHGVASFIIIQPFGCLPNQITGKGIIASLKERFPCITILPLDYDYDTSMANLENRLQMLIMNTKQRSWSGGAGT
ncbi:MAG: hypothetical protein JW768_13435 [Chitinispirillaceae bacterium]|nr:hypothetical protein [Chitinispirillaceae bacterium]